MAEEVEGGVLGRAFVAAARGAGARLGQFVHDDLPVAGPDLGVAGLEVGPGDLEIEGGLPVRLVARGQQGLRLVLVLRPQTLLSAGLVVLTPVGPAALEHSESRFHKLDVQIKPTGTGPRGVNEQSASSFGARSNCGFEPDLLTVLLTLAL